MNLVYADIAVEGWC